MRISSLALGFAILCSGGMAQKKQTDPSPPTIFTENHLINVNLFDSGPNCHDTALMGLGIVNGLRMVDTSEASLWLSWLCEKTDYHASAVHSLWARGKIMRSSVLSERDLIAVDHSAYVLSSHHVLEKKNLENNAQIQINTVEDSFDPIQDLFLQCHPEKIKQQPKSWISIYQHARRIEPLLTQYYTGQLHDTPPSLQASLLSISQDKQSLVTYFQTTYRVTNEEAIYELEGLKDKDLFPMILFYEVQSMRAELMKIKHHFE